MGIVIHALVDRLARHDHAEIRMRRIVGRVYRPVIARATWGLRADDLVWVDVLECGHEVLTIDHGMTHRPCEECL